MVLRPVLRPTSTCRWISCSPHPFIGSIWIPIFCLWNAECCCYNIHFCRATLLSWFILCPHLWNSESSHVNVGFSSVEKTQVTKRSMRIIWWMRMVNQLLPGFMVYPLDSFMCNMTCNNQPPTILNVQLYSTPVNHPSNFYRVESA